MLAASVLEPLSRRLLCAVIMVHFCPCCSPCVSTTSLFVTAGWCYLRAWCRRNPSIFQVLRVVVGVHVRTCPRVVLVWELVVIVTIGGSY